jgi:hypothetical protein
MHGKDIALALFRGAKVTQSSLGRRRQTRSRSTSNAGTAVTAVVVVVVATVWHAIGQDGSRITLQKASRE